MTKYQICKASIEYLEDIFRLECQYGKEVFSKESISSMFNYDYYHTYVMLIDNKVIGYISATIIIDECNLLKIIIDDKYRKNGYGKILLKYLIEICKNNSVDKIYLEVRKDNLIAKNFYMSFGFKKESERPGYYDGIDAEIFWYYIND